MHRPAELPLAQWPAAVTRGRSAADRRSIISRSIVNPRTRLFGILDDDHLVNRHRPVGSQNERVNVAHDRRVIHRKTREHQNGVHDGVEGSSVALRQSRRPTDQADSLIVGQGAREVAVRDNASAYRPPIPTATTGP